MKYLGVKIDGNLNWKNQTYGIVTNLNKANALLPKTRNYVSFNTLKAIYFEMFDLYIKYTHVLWGKDSNRKLRIIHLQKKNF